MIMQMIESTMAARRDPSQNSKAAREAMARCHSELLKIPP